MRLDNSSLVGGESDVRWGWIVLGFLLLISVFFVFTSEPVNCFKTKNVRLLIESESQINYIPGISVVDCRTSQNMENCSLVKKQVFATDYPIWLKDYFSDSGIVQAVKSFVGKMNSSEALKWCEAI